MRRHSRNVRGARRSSRAGFTLVEVVIASSIMAILMAIALLMFEHSNRSLGQTMVIADVSQRANMIEDRLQELLRSAGNFERDDTISSDGVFDRISFRERTGIRYSPTVRSVRWVAENDNDRLTNDGRLEVLADGVLFFELGRDVKNDFRVDYFQPASVTPALGQQPGADDEELRVTFTVMGVLGFSGNAVEVYEERREVRVWMRNR